MAAAIKAKLLEGKGEAAEDDAELDILCDAIGAAVVEYLKANALITGTASVAGGSSSGSHPVTGTVT
jgi:hypothetical protein